MRFDISDEEWALLEPSLPKSRKSARVDDRKIECVLSRRCSDAEAAGRKPRAAAL